MMDEAYVEGGMCSLSSKMIFPCMQLSLNHVGVYYNIVIYMY